MPIYWINEAEEVVETGMMTATDTAGNPLGDLLAVLTAASWAVLGGVGYWFSNYAPGAIDCPGGVIVIYWYPKNGDGGGPPSN